MDPQELFNKDKLSKMTYSFCIVNKVNSISGMMQHFNSYKNLNCSDLKAKKELIELSQKHFMYAGQLNRQEFLNIIDALNPRQKLIVNNYINLQLPMLSARSKKGLAMHLNNDVDLEAFVEFIFSSANFNSSKIFNVGKTSVPEIDAFIKDLKEFILQANNNPCAFPSQLLDKIADDF